MPFRNNITYIRLRSPSRASHACETIKGVMYMRSLKVYPRHYSAQSTPGEKAAPNRRRERIWPTLWCVVLIIALAALTSACSAGESEISEAAEIEPLTAEELYVFNHQSFNQNNNRNGFDLNQFLLMAVEAPEDYRKIDLYQLFYNGTPKFADCTEEERQAVADVRCDGHVPYVDLIKCPADQMNEVLQEFLGLSLEDMDGVGLDRFTYLPEYDAYYDFHSDANCPGKVNFLSGERKGSKVLLYYESDSFPVLSSKDGSPVHPDGTRLNCLTLEEQESGWYHFLSNWRCHKPSLPTAYPAGEPELTIPLDGLEPYKPEAVTVKRHTGDVAEPLYQAAFSGNPFRVEVYRSTEGSLYAAVAGSGTERDCFLSFPKNDLGWTAEGFASTFGYPDGKGFVFTYYRQIGDSYSQVHDYFTFSEDGVPSRLLQTVGTAEETDLNGDGIPELTVSRPGANQMLFFLRDGEIYQADVTALIQDAWPEAKYLECGLWNAERRNLSLTAQVPFPGLEDVSAAASRTLWFDGEVLRLYKDYSVYSDHVKLGLDAPAYVLDAAQDFVQGQFDALAADGYGWDGSGNYDEGNAGLGNVVWDDWRINGLIGPYYETAGDIQVEIWRINYDTHTVTPDRVMLPGASYRDEDGWCMIGLPFCDYLYFQLDTEGNWAFLFSKPEYDCSPGSPLFWWDMVYQMLSMDLLRLSDLSVDELLAPLAEDRTAAFFNHLGEAPQVEQEQILFHLARTIQENPDRTEYADCVNTLCGSGEYDLTDAGRTAWEQLQSAVGF